MNSLKRFTTWLLLLTVITASGLVSAKVASGSQNLAGGLHQENLAANALLHLAKIDISTDDTSGSPVAAKGAAKLTSRQQKSIRSLEKQISKHEKKLQDFKDNPTVRPGMEKLPKDVIQKQQQRRIDHLETEIDTFKNNIDKIKPGEIDS